MMYLEFSEEEQQSLYYERFHHPHPRVQKKMEALWLKSQKLPHHQISKLAGISPNTLRSYLRDYQEGGIEKLTGSAHLIWYKIYLTKVTLHSLFFRQGGLSSGGRRAIPAVPSTRAIAKGELQENL